MGAYLSGVNDYSFLLNNKKSSNVAGLEYTRVGQFAGERYSSEDMEGIVS